MIINLRPVTQEEKETLREMVRVYQQEIAPDVKAQEYKYFENYWKKENHFPFFIIFHDEVAGFVLVNNHTLLNKSGMNMAEFFVLKEFRRKGIGQEAALQAIRMFEGPWEIRQTNVNGNACKFWKKVLDRYFEGKYKETILNTEQWKGPVQTLVS